MILNFDDLVQHALVSPSSEQYEILMETIKHRVEDTQGETIYEVGMGGRSHLVLELLKFVTS